MPHNTPTVQQLQKSIYSEARLLLLLLALVKKVGQLKETGREREIPDVCKLQLCSISGCWEETQKGQCRGSIGKKAAKRKKGEEEGIWWLDENFAHQKLCIQTPKGCDYVYGERTTDETHERTEVWMDGWSHLIICSFVDHFGVKPITAA